jgi:hypothetical protein
MLALALLTVSVVVDVPQREVYLGGSDGSITALALANGAALWSEAHAGVPLVATARGLAVLEREEPHALRVSLRGARDGRRRWQSGAIALPEWAGADAALDVQVRLERGGLRVAWRARAAGEEASGETRALDDGTLATVAAPTLAEKVAALETVPVRIGERVETHPFVVGNEIVALRRQGEALLFERYSLTGARLSRRVILHQAAEDVPARVSLTADQLALVLPGAPTPAKERVMLLRVPSGLTLVTINVPAGAQEVQLAEGHIVFVDGEKLEVVDGRSGARQWQHGLPGEASAGE